MNTTKPTTGKTVDTRIENGPKLKPFLLTTEEAAIMLGVSKSTLNNSRCKGQSLGNGRLLGTKPPKYVKLGKIVRYRVSDLTDWIETLKTNI